MKVYGNVDGVKKAIEFNFEKKVKEVNLELEEKLAEINSETQKVLKTEIGKIKSKAEAESREARAKALNEQKLKAKREFEEAREELIDKVFDKVKEEAEKVVESSKYIDYVKKHKPKDSGIKTIVGSEKLKKEFSGELDKNLVGVKFVSGKITYDFSLTGMIEAEKPRVRKVITDNLFGE